MRSASVPVGYRVLASLGALSGLLLMLVGFLTLIVGRVLAGVLARYAGFSMPAAITQLPVWVGWVSLVLGLSCFVWGRGMQHLRDWSLFAAAVFLIHLGLYASLLIWLLHTNRVSVPSALASVMEEISMPAWTAGAAIVMLLLLSIFGAVFALLRSPRILAAYEEKYSDYPPVMPTCPNIDCRVILPEPGSPCDRCEPEYVRALLVPLDDGADPHVLRFAPGRDRIRLSRYEEGLPYEEQTEYFNPDEHEYYASISAPHAAIAYHGEEGKFFLMDLDSTYHTLVDGKRIPPREMTLLSHLSEIQMGQARFRFEIDYGDS